MLRRWTRWGRVPGLGLAVFVATAAPLGGCATPAAPPRPDDFPLHAEVPPLNLHWRLSVTPDTVRADGLVERRNAMIVTAWLQLLGLDETGRIVSFTTPLPARWHFGSDLEFFTIRLRPRGGERRFEVRLHSFEYLEEAVP